MTSDPQAPPPSDPAAEGQFPCRQCGAKMAFDPAAASIKCPYCGHENVIPQSQEQIEELDFHKVLARSVAAEDMQEVLTVNCAACGAETTLEPNVAADACPFCGSTLSAEQHSSRKIKPRSLLPFAVNRDQAFGAFRDWLKGLWFAPNKLKHYARSDVSTLNGLYVPYWTYDCNTVSAYTGERGEDYWETRTRTDSKGNTRTQQVRKTRWYRTSGVVYNSFDDILVLASTSLPKKHADELEPWDLHNLVAYDTAYLAGFRAENYQVDLEEGFHEAQRIMDDPIRESIKRDIGGDRQRIHSVRTEYNNVTFKHLLLPVWISAYRFKDRVFRFLVNARTGEVQGERPWSWWKIALAVAAGVAVIATVAYLAGAFN